MRLAGRVRKLEGIAPPRPARVLPSDPVSFARGLLAGAFTVADTDPTNPHIGWLARLCAFLVTLSPGHQEHLRRCGGCSDSEPGTLLLPAPKEQTLAALDAVMQRGDRMGISGRVRKPEGEVPCCNGRVTKIVSAGYALAEEDRRRLCGGCHVLEIHEVIVERGPDGQLLPVGAGQGEGRS